MSYLTQRFANRFPIWTKLRSDPSSLGQRIYSVFADQYEATGIEKHKIGDLLNLLTRDVWSGTLWVLNLGAEDEYPITRTGGRTEITYPTSVVGTDVFDFALTRAEYFEDFLYGVPSRLVNVGSGTVTTWTVWTSAAPTAFNQIDKPERLVVSVSNSDVYNKTELDYSFGGHHCVILTGEDMNHQEIREHITITDDGDYWTLNPFSSLSEVDWDGFDGDIVIKLGASNPSVIEDPYRLAVGIDIEGPLLLRVANGGGGAELQSTTKLLLRGTEYRRTETAALIPENEDYICTQSLLDSSGVTYVVEDYAINPYDGRLYTLDRHGYIHIYDLGLTPFSPPGTEPDSETYVELISLLSRVALNTEVPVWTWFRVLRGAGVASAVVRRVSPSGVVRYLQADLTWGVSSYTFYGEPTDIPEKSWQDIKFSVVTSELGQWDLYVTVVISGVEGTHTAHTAIMCESLMALASYDTGLMADGIYFAQDGRLVVVSVLDYTILDARYDIYYADVDRQRMFFRDPFTSVGVSYV